MATDALVAGFEETMWIESDIVFEPDAVERLRKRQLPICCAIYPQKGRRVLACHVSPGTKTLLFGKSGGVTEILYGATGFLHVRRVVYQRMQYQLELPVTNERFGNPMIPYFQPMIRTDHEGQWYLAEDFAFCERARRCGFKIFADTSIRLWHVGNYSYGWEDSGISCSRYDDFTLNL